MSNYPDLGEFYKQNMLNLFTLLIVPNISITDDDLEEYEFEPDTYVKNDLEESDTETRRRQCMKFDAKQIQNLDLRRELRAVL